MSKLIPAQKKRLLTIARTYGTPVYAYDAQHIERQCKKLMRHFPDAQIHYAIKANANPAILKIIKAAGCGVEAVSVGELKLAQSLGFPAERISFTCSNITEKELVAAARAGVRVHLDSLHQLTVWGAKKLGKEVSLRLNQGIGAGHHAHVITGGPDSKFGISLKDVPQALRIAKKYGLTITGLQQHIGSNILNVPVFERAMTTLLKTADTFPDLLHIDFGGGFGIPYEPGEKPLPLEALGKRATKLMKEYYKKRGYRVAFAFEPGRYVVAEAGTLLVEVTDIKSTDKHLFVGVNSGFNQLIRPAMYDSFHPIENLSRARGPRKLLTIAGNVCESGDILARKRRMVTPQIGDVLAIGITGAYGFSMASVYNLRALPKQILYAGKTVKNVSVNPTEYAV